MWNCHRIHKQPHCGIRRKSHFSALNTLAIKGEINIAFGETILHEEVLMPGIFEERERGYEAKWAHDEESHFKILARRNDLLGRWAAGELS
jgi:hypothetical protein